MEQQPSPGHGDVAEVLALAERVGQAPQDDSAAGHLARRCRGRAWLGGIPAAREAIVDVMVQFLVQYPTGSDSPLQLACTAIEPPSAIAALHMPFPRAEIHPQRVSEPDPRVPLYPMGEGAAVVWRYKGMLARPAVVAPSTAAAERVRALAVPVWPHIPAIVDRAAELADLPLSDLLGVLVHPPAPPAGAPAGQPPWGRPDVWIRAVQALACLGIAQHRRDQPWHGSRRAQVLLELLNGPEDWITEAAAFALVASAWMDPRLRRDVGSAVAVRWFKAVEASDSRAVTILYSLTELVLACPWLGARVIDPARDLLVRIRQTEPDPLPADREARLGAVARSHAPAQVSPPRRRFGFRRG
jgi:hypothetical protein